MAKIPRTIRWVFLISLLLLVLMSAARLGTWLTFRLPVTGSGGAPGTGRAFWLGFRYDARIVGAIALVTALITALPVADPFRNPRALKGWTWFYSIIALALVVFYAVDFLHFRYLNQRLNASALSFLQDAAISAKMVWQTYPVIRILLAVIVLTWGIVWMIRYFYRSIKKSDYRYNRPVRVIGYIGGFLVLAVALFGRVGQYPLRWSDAFNLGSDFNANIALNPIQSFASSFKFRGSGYDAKKMADVYPEMAAYLGVEHPDPATLNFRRNVLPDTIANWQGATTPNVVLVICESFSAYKSSMWGSPLNTTPYFAGMCKEGLFFDNCFTPLIGTAKGVWATVTGIPDVELVKTASRNPLMVDQATILNEFKDHERYYFLGGSTSWANIRGILTNNIHNLHLYEEGDYDVPRVDVWGISDKNLFLQADKILSKEQKPFFAIIQTADNHRPYTIPEEDRAAVGLVNFPKDTLNRYGFENNDELNAFRYTDYCFKTFMEKAKASPYFNNTLFVFIGDHGIAGNGGPLFPPAWTENGLTANHVPLLFYAPGKIPVARLHDVASQVDVLPTIAGIANIPYRNSALGRDLMARHAADSGSSNRAFILEYNNKRLGMIFNNWYFTRPIQGGKPVMAWADFAQPDPKTTQSFEPYDWWSKAYYETARYLLLNNKKKE
ncbi:LTA synthase family protein [Flavihumibacter petaseus]|uniref:Sulfatase N-terminal domain-containing protein n=1 Tax=Flavihumibacter petaseus NBRC 106054 TaxID=1220578 RepID=A0A0E9N0M9_9BACT|nr:alkaline phosphatase family protein [Flavihumibacter petaseus]GAO43562.1 hypothetical protein FPE01S_02_06670 [Flavihumibacter petaseus NBRC 106054]